MDSLLKIHLKQMISVVSGKQREFYEWELNVGKLVNIVSYHTNPLLSSKVEDFLEIHTPNQKECYETAYKLVDMYDDIEYVEGLINFKGIPIEHAWNYYRGIYFDLTGEIVFEREMGDEYLQLIKIKQRKMHELALLTGTYCPYYIEYYKKYVLRI